MFSHSVIVLGGRGQPAAAAAGTSEEAHSQNIQVKFGERMQAPASPRHFAGE